MRSCRPGGRAPCLRRSPATALRISVVAGRGASAGDAVCHGDRGQPAQQRRRAQPFLLGGDVQRDGAGLGWQGGQGVPAGPVGEVGTVGGAGAAGAREGGVLEPVSQGLDEALQLAGDVDGVQQRVGDRGLVRVSAR